MHAPGPSREPTRAETLTALVFFLVILGLFTAEVIRDFHPVKLSILFIVLARIPLLVWHEAAHALMALLLGWKVRRVVVGFGRPIYSFRLREVEVVIRLAPVLGFTVAYPRDDRSPRIKDLLIYFAGPLSALSVLGAVVLAVGWDTLFTATDNVAMIAAQSLAAAAALDLAVNLVPMITPGPGGDFSPNDGMGMIFALRRPRLWYRQQAARWRQVEAGIMREPPDGM